MSEHIEFACPSCGKRLKAPPFSGQKSVVCPKCSHKFPVVPRQAYKPIPPAPQAAKPVVSSPIDSQSGTDDDEGWFVLQSDGNQFGPYDFNDLQNFASQGRLTLDSSVKHRGKTKDKWVSVSRMNELTSLMQQSASIQVQIATATATSFKSASPEYSQAASIPILVSAIGNVVVAFIYVSTCVLAPLGAICILLCVFEFIFFSKRENLSLREFRDKTLWLGIAEIVVGLVNLISLVCGILVFVLRPSPGTR